jgi:SAM-dependent methyltransferase
MPDSSLAEAVAPRSAGAISSQEELLRLLDTLYNSRNPTRRWLHCTRRDWIIAKLRELARVRSQRALEVGFGAGVYLPTLAETFAEVTATDVDRAHLRHAQSVLDSYSNLRLATDDITDSKLPASSFDVILCSEVLEHIPATDRVVAGLRRLLAPGGFLLLSTPQRYSLMELACRIAFLPGVIGLVRRIYGEAIFETGHVNLLTERQLRRSLAAHGFTIREQFKSGLYIPMLAEFGSERAQQIAQALEQRVRRGRLSFALWTQYYVAQVI